MEITRETRLSAPINQYPWLKDELPKINEKFKMLNMIVYHLTHFKKTQLSMRIAGAHEGENKCDS